MEYTGILTAARQLVLETVRAGGGVITYQSATFCLPSNSAVNRLSRFIVSINSRMSGRIYVHNRNNTDYNLPMQSGNRQHHCPQWPASQNVEKP